jgi:hypothetical protein
MATRAREPYGETSASGFGAARGKDAPHPMSDAGEYLTKWGRTRFPTLHEIAGESWGRKTYLTPFRSYARGGRIAIASTSMR